MTKRIIQVLGLSFFLMTAVSGMEKEASQPTETEAKSAEEATRAPRRMWADSLLWTDAPKLEFAKWLTAQPDMKGKFVLVEFWRSWCGACKRATPRLNALQKKFGSNLVVVAVTAQKEAVVKAYKGPRMEYALALDKPRPAVATDEEVKEKAPLETTEEETGPCAGDPKNFRKDEQGAFEAHFGVWGWPHAVLLEPTHRCVIWEGYPDLKGYELTEEKVGKYIAIHKKSLKKAEAPAKAKPASE